MAKRKAETTGAPGAAAATPEQPTPEKHEAIRACMELYGATVCRQCDRRTRRPGCARRRHLVRANP